MSSKFINGVRIFFLYWLCCLIIGFLATLMSIGALNSSQFKLSKASSIVARGALFPYIQLSKLTGTSTFQAWEKGLMLLEDLPSFAQKVKKLQKAFTEKTALPPELISDTQKDYQLVLSQFSSFQSLLSESLLYKKLLPYKAQSKFDDLTKNDSIFLSIDLFLQFIAQRLAQNKPTTFLILFENNMELRPTGGFTGSYGLLRFANNEPIRFDVQDIYVPDGQLQGHVDPPLPIQEAFQQGFWKLRDANWHPDFSESVERVKWFFSEANGPEFDGVIAVTFTPIQQLLQITGPIPVADLNTTISSENAYQVLQRMDSTPFPGSTEKKDTLSAFSNQLLFKLQHLSPGKYLQVLSLISKSLTEKNLLLAINDENIAKLALLNNWEGTLSPPVCTKEGCNQDYFSIFEANLGVNKSNCCVNRDITLDKVTVNDTVQSEVKLHYYNKGPGDEYTGVAGDYKAFIRLYFPENTTITPPVINGKPYTQYMREMKQDGYFHPITSTGFSLETVHNLKELGLWILVPPEQELTLQFETSTALHPLEPYSLIVQKQPGTLESFNQLAVSVNQRESFQGILTTDQTFR